MEENKTLEPEDSKIVQIPVETPADNLENEISKPAKPQSLLTQSMMFRFMLVFGIVFMCFVFVFQVWLTPIKVVGSSMQPTINVAILSEDDEDHCDVVYFDDEKSYSHDDVVIIKNNDYKYIPKEIKDEFGNILFEQDVKYLIKRVIACPGDSITFMLTGQDRDLLPKVFYYDIIVKDSDGNVVNLDDSYIEEEMQFTAQQIREYSELYPFSFGIIFANIENTDLPLEERKYTLTIPEDTYFVMGDNRNNSEDSRYFGVVSYEDISGSVRFQIPYGKNLFQAIWIKLKSII